MVTRATEEGKGFCPRMFESALFLLCFYFAVGRVSWRVTIFPNPNDHVQEYAACAPANKVGEPFVILFRL